MAGIMQRWQGAVLAKLLYALTGGIKQDGASAAFVYVTGAAPVNGTSGTLAGVAQPGSLLLRTDSPALYQNTNTKASPTWTAAPLTGAAGITSGTIAGVTIDNSAIGGSTPAAGAFTTLSTTGILQESAAAAITASVTQTQVGATALTKKLNQISVCANAGDAVKLPLLAPGEACVVFNDGANPASVFPSTGQNIDGAGANAAVTLTNAKRAIYYCITTGVIESAQLGVASA